MIEYIRAGACGFSERAGGRARKNASEPRPHFNQIVTIRGLE